jgi:catechol 2,3-dioxygenase
VEIAPDAHMGLVELSVSDLDRSLAYWQEAIGLRVLSRQNGTAELGAGTPLLRFVEEPGVRPADGFTGLFHVALLVPDRPSLGRFLAHAARDEIRLEGLSDHDVSEAIYLRDPDRHGIEIYADRPREHWEGKVFERMTTRPLDTDSLLAEAGDAGFDGLPAGTTMGHVHLRVRDIDETIGFYRDVLGMGLMAQLGDAAAFLSAGGYHHHLGANVWESRGAPPAPEGTARLRHLTIVVPDEAERDRLAAAVGGAEEREDGVLVRDPSGNGLLLSSRSSAAS